MKTLFLLFMLIPFVAISQTLIGEAIDGEAANDGSGIISLSNNGNIVAIGARSNDDAGENAGHVRVFEFLNGIWTQIGDDIDGEGGNDFSGEFVSLSGDGSVVAIAADYNGFDNDDAGQVRIFKNISSTWTQIGDAIIGEAPDDYSGESISLSLDGSVVAIGAQYNDDGGDDAGHVRVYENLNGVWTQLGDDIDGLAIGDRSGKSVSLSSDGNILAIGAIYSDGIVPNTGYVRVFEKIGESWIQIGTDIDGEAEGDISGWSVSLSSDGDIVAIGARFNSDAGFKAGHVRIYENSAGTWTQIGDDIDGEAAEDESGYSISISPDGSTVAIGAVYNTSGSSSEQGHVRVYENIGNVWTQIGNDIDGEFFQDRMGLSVSLSYDGSIVATGMVGFSPVGAPDAGQVRIYDLSVPNAINEFVSSQIALFPNPVVNTLHIELNSDLTLEKVMIYNSLGQFIRVERTAIIDVSTLLTGIYFVEIITNKGNATKSFAVK